MLDARTLGFADFRGNRQHISEGNLIENARAFLFLIDYVARSRIKIRGTARFEEDPELVARLMLEGYVVHGERAVLFDVAAWDAICPQHIPRRFEAEDVVQALATRDRRIAEFEAEFARLRDEV